jgi:heat shock protein HspQ
MQSPLSPVGGSRLVFHEVIIIFLSFDICVRPFFCLENLSPAEIAAACKTSRFVPRYHVFLSTDAPPRVPTSSYNGDAMPLTRLISKTSSEHLKRNKQWRFVALWCATPRYELARALSRVHSIRTLHGAETRVLRAYCFPSSEIPNYLLRLSN